MFQGIEQDQQTLPGVRYWAVLAEFENRKGQKYPHLLDLVGIEGGREWFRGEERANILDESDTSQRRSMLVTVRQRKLEPEEKKRRIDRGGL
jgi:hypothetical protein